MKFLFSYLNRRRKSICVGSLLCASTALMFYLYDLAWEPFCYILAFWFFLYLPVFWLDFRHDRRCHRGLAQLAQNPNVCPPSHNLVEQDYQALIHAIADNHTQVTADYAARSQELTDYYTLWAHQIKTPIAAMRLTLQGEDTPAARRLMTELGRVEQYVDMALTYLRLEEGGSDYVIRTCAVDDVVRAAVRRFAGEFIDRRIALDYTPVEWETVTDGKWLTFVVEQLLSNALKYTGQDGTVRIYREGDDLCIRDSGMGIAPEDLPRVFDMGYTGQNGRLDRRSSGIGLYLCRRICRNLRHEIRIESVPGVGTTVRLTLGRPAFVAE